ncbi:interleukin-18-binding protein [Monodelphis domestica]|uniref:interleukin-18-binding protein n=1 Tax=Monodelphis domestica TaxID=13616 RepID=UPI0024E1C2D4|nr:interleukin-18-binding protein [Monodelphis domestica]
MLFYAEEGREDTKQLASSQRPPGEPRAGGPTGSAALPGRAACVGGSCCKRLDPEHYPDPDIPKDSDWNLRSPRQIHDTPAVKCLRRGSALTLPRCALPCPSGSSACLSLLGQHYSITITPPPPHLFSYSPTEEQPSRATTSVALRTNTKTEGLKVLAASLVFSGLLSLVLSWPLARDAEQLCPKLDLEVTVRRSESEILNDGPLTLTCRGCSPFPHSSIMYWLGNHSFIEDLPGALHESQTRRQRESQVTWLQRDLVLEELSPELTAATNFSCVLVDPAQLTQRHILLAQLQQEPGPRTLQTLSVSHQLGNHSAVPSPTTSGHGEEASQTSPWTAG